MYGYKYGGNAYKPHITIGRTKEDKQNDNTLKALENANLAPNIAPVVMVTVYKMDPDGTHQKTLYKCPIR